MKDINNMTIKDFNGLLRYLDYEDKKMKHQPIPLKESQKDMITKFKEKEK